MVQGAGSTRARTFHDVEVNHGGGDVGMTEETLNGADVSAGLKQVRREGMAHRVRSDALGDTCFANRFPDLACHRVVVEMVAGDFAGAWVWAKGCGGKHVLPAPLSGSVWVFPY